MEHEPQRPSEEWLNGLTERIIGCASKVSNALGCGFLEKVCENALVHELRKRGLRADPQQPVNVYYDGVAGVSSSRTSSWKKP